VDRAARFAMRVPLEFRVADQTKWLEAHTVNMSASGALLESAHEQMPGARLWLRSKKGDGESSVIAAICNVVRTERIGDKDLVHLGVQFLRYESVPPMRGVSVN
jgi:hypothetical protein